MEDSDSTPWKNNLSKKRHASQISVSSTPSPIAKMPNLNENFCDEEETGFSNLDLDLNTGERSLHNKMDQILEKLSVIQKSLETHKQETGNELDSLKRENKNLKLRLMETEGQAARMSKDIEKLKKDFEDLEVRSMSHNIVLYNVPEKANEDIYKPVSDFFTKMLKLPDQIPKLKALRDQYKSDTSTKIVLSKDKLRLNNTLVPSDFETNPISVEKPESWMPFEYDSIQHSEVIEFSGSSFQGHMVKISNMDEVKRAYCALLQNPKTAGAHHIMYAYS